MKIKKLFFCLAITFLISNGLVFSQSKNISKFGISEQAKIIPDTLKIITTNFFDKLLNNKTDEAFSELLKNSPIGENKIKFDNLVRQSKLSNDVYGLMFDYEYVNTEIPGNSICKIEMLALHADYPMRWILTFYKSPARGWIVINVKFDDLMDNLFKID